jgi:hypothetical protein
MKPLLIHPGWEGLEGLISTPRVASAHSRGGSGVASLFPGGSGSSDSQPLGSGELEAGR